MSTSGMFTTSPQIRMNAVFYDASSSHRCKRINVLSQKPASECKKTGDTHASPAPSRLSGENVLRYVGMRAFDDSYAGLGYDFLYDLFFVWTLLGNAGRDMDHGGLFVHGRVPELDLHKPGHDGRGRTAAAADHADDLRVGVLVDLKDSLPSVEGHQAPRTADAHVVHGVLAPHNQNLLHSVPPLTG